MSAVSRAKEEGAELIRLNSHARALTVLGAARRRLLAVSPLERESAVWRRLHEAITLNLSLASLKINNNGSALTYAEEARKVNPVSVKALFRKAQALQALRRFGAAELVARQGLHETSEHATQTAFRRLLFGIPSARQQLIRSGGVPVD